MAHRNSEFSHETWWIFRYVKVYQRVAPLGSGYGRNSELSFCWGRAQFFGTRILIRQDMRWEWQIIPISSQFLWFGNGKSSQFHPNFYAGRNGARCFGFWFWTEFVKDPRMHRYAQILPTSSGRPRPLRTIILLRVATVAVAQIMPTAKVV